MSPTVIALLWLLVGAGIGGAVVAVVLLRREGRREGGPGAAAAGRAAEVAAPETVGGVPSAVSSGVSSAVSSGVPSGVPSAVSSGVPSDALPAGLVSSIALRLYPQWADPSGIRVRTLVKLGGLRALARDAAPTAALAADDLERLVRSVDEVAAGGVLALPGPTRSVLDHALHELHVRLGDVPVLGVPVPLRADVAGAARQPLRAIVLDPARLVRAGRCILLVEDAELHLRRGLDASSLARLREAAPEAVIVLQVGACEHDASSLDDTGRWLSGLLLDVGGDRIAAAGAHAPSLDLPLLAAVGRTPLLADLAEAAAYARAAGRLPDVPLHVAARVAALIAGGRAEEPASDEQLAAALAEDTSRPPLLRVAPPQRAGLARTARTVRTVRTVRAPSLLVARCVADPGVITPALLAVLLEDADDVERLLVARRLTAGVRPGLALPVLDALVGHPDVLIAAEARLVRGVARDRLGLASAADDYHAVATGRHGTLSAHGAFLLGGILETATDLAPARAAYRSAMAAADPVHSAMAAFNLAWLEERTGGTEAALAGYRAVAEGPHREAAAMAALNLATLLERLKRFAECESWYRVALEAQHPDTSPMAGLSLGLMLERRQRPREARVLFRQVAASGHAEAAQVALRRLGAPNRRAVL